MGVVGGRVWVVVGGGRGEGMGGVGGVEGGGGGGAGGVGRGGGLGLGAANASDALGRYGAAAFMPLPSGDADDEFAQDALF